MFKQVLNKIMGGNDLSGSEAEDVMEAIMNGEASDSQIAAFITALRFKGETIEEITACARVMRKKAVGIKPDIGFYVDTCGTGGDRANTFNISTAAALVTSAAGVPVAKHGNRSVSSRSGSADVLEALGMNIELTPGQVERCMEDMDFGFMFAPYFHPSMRYAAVPRRELGIRTVFNILGPLTNPADAKGQLLGVYSESLMDTMARVLLNLGVEKAMIVHGKDGLDEITLTGSTVVSEIKGGQVIKYELNPEDYDLMLCNKDSLTGGDKNTNAGIIISILQGEKGVQRDIVALNSGAAIYLGGKAASIEEGIKFANNAIDSFKAAEKLEELKAYTNKLSDS